MKEIISKTNNRKQNTPNYSEYKKIFKDKKTKQKTQILLHSNQNPKYQPEKSLFGYLWVSQFF